MKLLKSFISLLSAQASGRTIRFVYLVIVARYLDINQVGQYLYGIALYLSVISVALLGQNVFLSKHIAGKISKAKYAIPHSLLLTLLSTISIFILLVIFILATEETLVEIHVYLIFAVALVGRVVTTWIRFAYTALENTAWIPVSECTFRSVEALLGVLVLSSNAGGLLEIVVLHALIWFAESVYAVWKLRNDYSPFLRFRFSKKYMLSIAFHSRYYLLSSTALAVLAQLSVILVKNFSANPDIVGYYSIAMQFFTTLLVIPVVASSAFLPRASRAYKYGDGGRDIVTAAKVILVGSILLSVLASVLIPEFISYFLSDAYQKSIGILLFLNWIFPFYALSVFLGQCMNALDMKKQAAYHFIFMAIVHVVLFLVLYKIGLAIAAIMSLFVAVFIGSFNSVLQISKKMPDGRLIHTFLIILSVYTTMFFASRFVIFNDYILSSLLLLVFVSSIYAFRIFNRDDAIAIFRLLGR
ncbi:MAG: oligosaccharide flippase family protein [Gammaproteobacteria bacterium]|nr:oligosaccharide flippase family protein [Gammaproteobacteria bacterium]